MGNAKARTVFSVISVDSFDAFFGQDTQMAADSRIEVRARARSACSLALRTQKMWTISVVALILCSNLTSGGKGASQFPYPGGACLASILEPATMPSFLASGVPE